MDWMMVAATAVGACVLGTWVEYWAHRWMHAGFLITKHHAKHHQHGQGQGWLGEFRDYGLPTAAGALVVSWLSPSAGLGVAVGGLLYAAFAAYAHQVQHELPHHAWWMAQPQHAVHHYHREWHHNFGITVAWWDRVFGTYKAHEPLPRFGDGGPLSIHWTRAAPALPKRPGKRAR